MQNISFGAWKKSTTVTLGLKVYYVGHTLGYLEFQGEAPGTHISHGCYHSLFRALLGGAPAAAPIGGGGIWSKVPARLSARVLRVGLLCIYSTRAV